ALDQVADRKRENHADERGKIGEEVNARRHESLRPDAERLLRRRRIDDVADLADLVRWKAAALRMLADDVFVRCAIDAVDLVVGDVAVDPLDVRAKVRRNGATRLGRTLEIGWPSRTDPRHFALDNILRHALSP